MALLSSSKIALHRGPPASPWDYGVRGTQVTKRHTDGLWVRNWNRQVGLIPYHDRLKNEKVELLI